KCLECYLLRGLKRSVASRPFAGEGGVRPSTRRSLTGPARFLRIDWSSRFPDRRPSAGFGRQTVAGGATPLSLRWVEQRFPKPLAACSSHARGTDQSEQAKRRPKRRRETHSGTRKWPR